DMETVDVEGATGNVHTNYEGKAQAAIDAYKNGADLVFVHVEAPDECGHRAEIENKVLSIEYIDSRILKPVTDYLAQSGEPYALMALPDHPTPIEIRTHSMEPVPFLIWRSDKKEDGVSTFTEKMAIAKNRYVSDGTALMGILVQKAGN
ncbi:MAG: phosphoglycerate mutase, partial [Clostridia bacterium]|nr:phosphoglycerate mutase [Clostridia bacterium]